MARINVLLPQPEGPATSSISPGWTATDRSYRAGSEARRYRKVRPSISTIGSAIAGLRSGRADRDRAVDGSAEPARRVGLVVGEGEATERVLVEERSTDRDLAEGARPGHGLNDRVVPVGPAELDAELAARRQLADGTREILGCASETEVAERVD